MVKCENKNVQSTYIKPVTIHTSLAYYIKA